MAFDLKKLVKKSYDQVNPLDGGRTFKSPNTPVRAPTIPASTSTSLLRVQPLQAGGSRVSGKSLQPQRPYNQQQPQVGVTAHNLEYLANKPQADFDARMKTINSSNSRQYLGLDNPHITDGLTDEAFNKLKQPAKKIKNAKPGDSSSMKQVAYKQGEVKQKPKEMNGLGKAVDVVSRGASRTVNQLNPLDNNRTWQHTTPTTVNQNAGQQIYRNNLVQAPVQTAIKSSRLVRAGAAGAAGLANIGYQSVVGTDQQYQNAVRKANQSIDAPLNRGSFMTAQQADTSGGGTQGFKDNFVKPVARGSAEIAPYVIPIGGKLGLGGAGSLGKRMAVQGVANGVVGGGANVTTQLADTGKVDWKQAAQATALSAVAGTTAPLAGAVGKAGMIKAATPVTNKLRDTKLIAPTRLNPDEVVAISNYNLARSGGANMDEATYFKGQAAAKKAGIDTNDSDAMTRVELDHRAYDVKQAGRKEALGKLRGTPLTEDGFVRLPGRKTELMATHNLNAENIAHAERLGGIPQASIGIVDPKKHAIDGYGDITLIGNQKLVDPKAPKTSTYHSDVYSPRQPHGELQIDRAGHKALTSKFANEFKETGTEPYDIEFKNIDDSMKDSPAIMAAYLKSKGIKPNVDTLEPDAYYRKRQTRNNLRAQIEQSNGDREFDTFVQQAASEAGAQNKIYGGTTNSGTQRWLDNTMENVLKSMRKEAKRGGDNTGGIGLMRSGITPKFKSLEDIYKNKDKLTDSQSMEAAKDTLERNLNDIQDKLDKYATNRSDNQFSEYDAHMQAITDYIKGDPSWFNQKFPTAPPALKAELEKFKNDLQHAPTEYFESVSDRAVQLKEFEKALVPENAPSTVIDSLRRQGIEPVTYKAGERQAMLNKLMEEDNLARGFGDTPKPTPTPKNPRNEWRRPTILSSAADKAKGMFDLGEGGYVKLPGGKRDPAPDLHPEQKTFINDYAEMLEGMDSTNGVSINKTTGTRNTTNSPTYQKLYNEYGSAPTKEQWFKEARQQIESGKAGYGASDEYKTIAGLSKDKPQLPAKQAPAPLQKTSDSLGNSTPTPAVSPTTKLVPQSPREAVPVLPEGRKQTNGGALPKSTPKVNEEALPTYRTNQVSNFDKVFRDNQSIIERQGGTGKVLSEDLNKARDTKEFYLADLQEQMPTVMKLANKGKNALVNKDFENFVEATQGLAKPKNEMVAKAITEWQATHPGIRNRAVSAGLDVGDLGQTYYPHFIDYDTIFKDVNKYNQSINHLVETGQAATPDEAIKLLSYAKDVSRNRQFGNLEAARTIDLPFYDKTPNSLVSYLNGSAKRIANTEVFGASDEKALKLIAKIGKEGGDTEAVKNAFDISVGAKMYNPTASKVSGNIRKYVTTTRLGLGALTNTSQSINTGIVTGHTRTLLAAAKQLDPKTRQFARSTGVISDALLNDLKTQQGYSSFTSKVLGKAINKVTAPGFGAVEKFNRSLAATAGRDYGLRLAQKGDEKALRKLGVQGEIKGKTLTEAQQIQVARRVVEKTQFKVDPQDLPGWTDTPGGKLVAQFRTFSYNQSKFFSNEVIKPLAKGNVQPAARMLAALPIGYGLYEARRMVDGRPEEENKNKVAMASFSKIGGAGLVLDLYQSLNPIGSEYIPTDRRVSMAAGVVGGPAVGVGIQAVGAVSDVVQRKNTPKDKKTLEGKVALAKTDDKYTDATSISRFGLSQIPIVGTPIKNRVLPYKKQSNAENGITEDKKAVAAATKAEADSNAKLKITGNSKKITTPTSLETLEADKKASRAALKASLSEEDYKLSTLSKADRKKLIDSGAYTQAKFDGLDKYVANQKQKLGLPTKKTAGTKAKKISTIFPAIKTNNKGTKSNKSTNGTKTAKGKSGIKKSFDYSTGFASINKTAMSNQTALRSIVKKKRITRKAKVV